MFLGHTNPLTSRACCATPAPPLQISILRMCVCARLLTFSFPSLERGHRERAKQVFPRSLPLSHICNVCSVLFLVLRNFYLFIYFLCAPRFLVPLSYCGHWSRFVLVRRWELFKCSPLPLSSALWCELGNLERLCEKVEGFCIGMIADVIFVPVRHCRH